jgi:hypothetical protein
MRSLEQSDSQQSEDGQVNAVGQFGKKNQRGNKDGVHGSNTNGLYGRGTFGQKTGTDQRCFNCNRVGHFARDTAMNVEFVGIFLRAAGKRIVRYHKDGIKKRMRAERRKCIR